MFTSRAEHRLVLREDNTLERLASLGEALGLLAGEDLEKARDILARQKSLLEELRARVFVPNEETQKRLDEMGTARLLKPATAEELLRRSEIQIEDLSKLEVLIDGDVSVSEPVEIQVKYSGYIQRQLELIEQTKRLEKMRLPADLDYVLIRGLSREEIEKLQKVRPLTLGQAQRISGVNPSAVQAILVYLKGRRKIRELSVEELQTTRQADRR
jgi:tRNA uridine 5-carboxymethylaminomethyl modification enzyme